MMLVVALKFWSVLPFARAVADRQVAANRGGADDEGGPAGSEIVIAVAVGDAEAAGKRTGGGLELGAGCRRCRCGWSPCP